MNDIIIRRKHNKTLAEVHIAAEHMISQLKDEFNLSYAWNGDTLNFNRPGVSGELTLGSQEVVLSINLALVFSALKPSIEREIHRLLDEDFQA